MTDQHRIIHLRVLKYAITLRCAGSIYHVSQRYGWKKAAQHNRAAIDCYGPFIFGCCCCCLSWLKQHQISQVLKFPHSKDPSVLTSDLNIEEPGSEHFPKHNQSIVKQRKIIPRRNLMSRPLNVSLFCQHELLPSAISFCEACMISFLYYC